MSTGSSRVPGSGGQWDSEARPPGRASPCPDDIAGGGKDNQIYLGRSWSCCSSSRPSERPSSSIRSRGGRTKRWRLATSRTGSSSPSSSRGDHLRARGRRAATRSSRCGGRCLHARRAQGLHVPVRPNLIVPWGNGLILGYLMYKSGLVPRRMAWFGLIGGPLLLLANFGVLFDWWEQTSRASILAAPEIISGRYSSASTAPSGVQARLAGSHAGCARRRRNLSDTGSRSTRSTAGPCVGIARHRRRSARAGARRSRRSRAASGARRR